MNRKKSKMKTCFLDFEYNGTTEKNLNVLCVAFKLYDGDDYIRGDSLWLKDEDNLEEFKTLMEDLRDKQYVLVAYAVQAEASALLSLGINPLHYLWIDLYLEYRCLLNHNHEYMYGKQLIKGKEVYTKPPIPKYLRTEQDEKTASSAKPEHTLAAACYKLLNKKIDTEHKDTMRQLIIAGGPFSEEQKENILDYCYEDVAPLRRLLAKFGEFYKKNLSPEHRATLKEDLHRRGEYAARTAIMERFGYPFDFEATKNFSSSVSSILFDLSEEINNLFPDIQPFLQNKKGDKFIRKEKNIRKWIESQGIENWKKTDTGRPSLSLEAFTDHFDYRHAYPDDCFGAQMVRFLKTKQSLAGFVENPKKKSFWDSVGSDRRVRPFYGIYGSQSSRSQPSSTSFIPLKTAWMRVLLQPNPGRAICGIDYSQQEFLIAGLLSRDMNMLDAYDSGDVYLYTGKLDGIIPQEATKTTHGDLRDKFKSTVLGIQYQMGPAGLALKLTKDTGKEHTYEEAEDLIESFNSSYPDYEEWRTEIVRQYQCDGYLRLPCGWVMWGDNENFRSVANCPIQGFGASVMRKAVAMAQNMGLDVLYTLHDAIYIEFDSDKLENSVATLRYAMGEAFKYYLDDDVKDRGNIRMDEHVWSPDYVEGEKISGIKVHNKHIDPRSINDYVNFRSYFSKKDEIELLTSI